MIWLFSRWICGASWGNKPRVGSLWAPSPTHTTTYNTQQDEDFAEAARLAFELRHPGRLLSVLRSQGPAAAAPTATALVKHMKAEDLKTALEYCRCVSRLCSFMPGALAAHTLPAAFTRVRCSEW